MLHSLSATNYKVAATTPSYSRPPMYVGGAARNHLGGGGGGGCNP